jgi:hypothetical protein
LHLFHSLHPLLHADAAASDDDPLTAELEGLVKQAQAASEGWNSGHEEPADEEVPFDIKEITAELAAAESQEEGAEEAAVEDSIVLAPEETTETAAASDATTENTGAANDITSMDGTTERTTAVTVVEHLDSPGREEMVSQVVGSDMPSREELVDDAALSLLPYGKELLLANHRPSVMPTTRNTFAWTTDDCIHNISCLPV